MKDIKLKRGIVDYVICGVAALFICVYASIAFQPVTSGETEPEPVVQEQHHTQILLRPDDPACGLQNLIHTRIAVGVGEAVHLPSLVVLPQNLPLMADLGQARPHDGGPDETLPLQVDALGEDAAQPTEAQEAPRPGWLLIAA